MPAARQDVARSREPAPGPTRERPTERTPFERATAPPTRTPPGPATSPASSFTNRPLPGKPAPADRPRPTAPGEPVKPLERSARPLPSDADRSREAPRDRTPMRPFHDPDADQIDETLPETSDSADDEIEYIDFGDVL